MILKKGTIKRIHVNQHMIRADRKGGTVSDVVSVATSRGTFRGRLVAINGESRIVYSPRKPRPCGARLWIETRAEIVLE